MNKQNGNRTARFFLCVFSVFLLLSVPGGLSAQLQRDPGAKADFIDDEDMKTPVENPAVSAIYFQQAAKAILSNLEDNDNGDHPNNKWKKSKNKSWKHKDHPDYDPNR